MNMLYADDLMSAVTKASNNLYLHRISASINVVA